MTQPKIIAVNGQSYSVTLERFDDVTASSEPSYHGYYVTVAGNGLVVKARKYDDESEMSIQSGIRETDLHGIEIVRDIARQLFNVDQLSLLTEDNLNPYKAV